MNIDVQIDGGEEQEFRRSIEQMLRSGEADAAAARIGALLPAYCGDGKVLPARFLTITAADIEVAGLDRLADRIAKLDRPGHPITAVSIDLANPWQSGCLPDADGRLDPYIETSFYSDDSFPFSRCDRSALLDGYSAYGSEWQGCAQDVDDTIVLIGIDDLYGAVEMIDAESSSDLPPTPDEQRGYVLGASYIAVLAHIAVRDTIARHGLPRQLAILVGNNERYPFLEAPVVAFLADGEEAAEDQAYIAVAPAADDEDEEAEAPLDEDGAGTASLLMIRKPALTAMHLPVQDSDRAPEAVLAPLSGSQLRRTVAAGTLEREAPQGGLRGLMGRLLRRA